MRKERKDINPRNFFRQERFMDEIGISVAFTSFMCMVDFFFIGLLLTGSSDMQINLRIPLVYLFISAFGFLYASLIFANASGVISRINPDIRLYDKRTQLANIISECFGIYFAVFAFPLVILGYSPDDVLACLVLIVDIAGFSTYHIIKISILSRRLHGETLIVLISSIIILYIISFILSFIGEINAYYLISTVLVIYVLAIFFIAVKLPENDHVVGKTNKSKYKK